MVPKFISRLFKELNSLLMNWVDTIWEGGDISGDKVRPPDFIKYTGDGSIMIWLDTEGKGFDEKCAQRRCGLCEHFKIGMRH